MPLFAQLTLGLPIFLVVAGALITLLKLPDPASRWLGLATVVGSATLLVVSVLMALTPTDSSPTTFVWLMGIQIHLDSLSVFFVLLINVVMLAASWNALSYLEGRTANNFLQKPAVFHTLINFFHFTMLLVPILDNLVGVFGGVSWQAQFLGGGLEISDHHIHRNHAGVAGYGIFGKSNS